MQFYVIFIVTAARPEEPADDAGKRESKTGAIIRKHGDLEDGILYVTCFSLIEFS
jgi:hypothetical protein